MYNEFKPYIRGAYHCMKLVDIPNNAGLNLKTYENAVRRPMTYAEQRAVLTTDQIIARLMAV